MRSRYLLALAVVLVAAAVVGLVVTQSSAQQPGMGMGRGMGGGMGMGRGGGMGGPGIGGMMGGPGMMGPGGCPMGHMMGRASMVAMGNHLYVMAGHRLMKYDQDLNLVKETELKADGEMMRRGMQSCPMMQQQAPGAPAPAPPAGQ